MFERITKEQVKTLFKNRPENSNKGDFGYVALIGGSSKYSGAIRLANMASSAMRAGAGVCTVAVPQSIAAVISGQILESTLLPLDDEDGFISGNDTCLSQIEILFKKYKAMAFGMGIGSEHGTKKILRYILEKYNGKLVVDADGLNAMAETILRGNFVRGESKLILTPHLMEFARLYSACIKAELIIDSDLDFEKFIDLESLTSAALDMAKVNGQIMAVSLAKALKCVVLLKGNTNYITDGNVSYMAYRGCPGMATAGSGDVLSGILAGLLGYNDDLVLATAGAAYINGLAGEIAEQGQSPITMIASDTANAIKTAILEILA